MYSSTTYTTAAAAAAAATRSNHRRAKKSGGRKSNTINKGKHDDTVIPKGSKRSSRALGDIDVNRNSNIITNGDNGGKNDRSVVIKKTPKLLLKSSAITAANNSSISNDIRETTTSSKEATALTTATFPTATTTTTTTTTAAAAAATIEALANENKKEKERDWKSIQKELDDLFLKTSNDRMENVPLIDIPQILIDNGVDLYQHQIDGIRWLVHKESGLSGVPPYYKLQRFGRFAEYYRCSLTRQVFKGRDPPSLTNSILADDMGLGKTLQSIGLILANPPVGRNGAKIYPYRKPRSLKAEVEPRTTLIVGPVSVLANWKIEIDRFVNAKKTILKVEIYAGIDRSKVLHKVHDGDLDILICSYQTLSSDWRKKQQQLEDEQETANENGSLDDDNVNVDDGDSNGGEPGESKRSKRSVAKKSYANSGTGAGASADSEDDYEDASESEFESDSDNDSDEDWIGDADEEEELSIFDQEFHRIILDEAHTIRNSKTAYFQSTNEIQAAHKLCITGTPFINHPRDIHSFLSFLNVSPLDDIKTFNEVVVGPIEERKEIGLARLRVVMSALAIRRTKGEVKREISLKKKTINIRKIEFPDDNLHKKVSFMLYHTCRNAFLALMQKGNKAWGRKQFLLFGLVTRVRQSCASCELIPQYFVDAFSEMWLTMKDVDVETLTGQEGDQLFDSIVQVLQKVSKASRTLKKENGNCSDSDDDGDEIQQDYSDSADEEHSASSALQKAEYGRSPKVQALMDAIREMEHDEKGVIFSQWTGFLDIIATELEIEGHSFTHLNGKMNAHQRIESMERFGEERGPRFILCSLMACGTGISLTRANHVYMMDCWWNVASEDQAMDRVHRIGQNRNVRAIRFIMKDSIEERFLNVQDAKQCLGKGSLEKLKKDDRSKARITAMKDLFEMGCDSIKWEGMYDDDDIDDDGADLKDFIVDDDEF